MSYFDSLRKELGDLLAWADLRHEQGRPVKGKMARLSRSIAALRKELEKAVRPASELRREPNDLEAVRALRPKGPRRLIDRLDAGAYADRVKGAFLARSAGCTLGAPVEGWPPERMKALAEHLGMDWPPTDYWLGADEPYRIRYGKDPRSAYTKKEMRYVPVDDDMTYTLLGLLILEDYGPDFSTADVGKAWMKYLPVACTAEKVALENLKAGMSWKKAAEKNNPYEEWIGADIRSDAWGYACPGRPEKAAEMAYRDAYISHRYNGIYGEMYFSAVIAAALVLDDPVEALRMGLTEIPRSCRLYEDVSWALKVAPKVADHVKAAEMVTSRFGPIHGGMSSVHTNNNACLTVWGVTIGRTDLTRVIGETVAMGYDNDCTAATAGSIVGAVIGARNVPPQWSRPFHNRARSYINGHEWFDIGDVCRRFAKIATSVVQAG